MTEVRPRYLDRFVAEHNFGTFTACLEVSVNSVKLFAYSFKLDATLKLFGARSELELHCFLAKYCSMKEVDSQQFSSWLNELKMIGMFLFDLGLELSPKKSIDAAND